MSSSPLAAFAAAAQSGQEMSRETLWEAEIKLEGTAHVIKCASANFSDANHELAAGGMFPEYAASFKVRLALLGTAPKVTQKLQWRRPGERAWRQTLEILRVSDPAADDTVKLDCEEAAKKP